MPPNRISQNIHGRKNIVAIGLLKIIKGRWACLPLSWRFYHLKKSIEKINRSINGPKIVFETKLAQAVKMITDIAEAFGQTRIVTITDSWFGNNGLFKPLHDRLGPRFHMVSRLRSNNNVFKLPEPHPQKAPGRPENMVRSWEMPLGWPLDSSLWQANTASVFIVSTGPLSPI